MIKDILDDIAEIETQKKDKDRGKGKGHRVTSFALGRF